MIMKEASKAYNALVKNNYKECEKINVLIEFN